MSPHPPRRKDLLETYRKKRSPEGTPEPVGTSEIERPGLFVVHMHDATRLHWDLRLEMDGVLRSWAVPKGPSLDPDDKRLAVMTEDHPLEYGDFEGVIPKDNYGAGAVIVWDRGAAIHHVDPSEGSETGKLLFELKGHKLRGLWTLVKTTRGEKEWLLIKKPDGAATGETVEELNRGSVFSGLTVEELAAGSDRAAKIGKQLKKLGAKRGKLDPKSLKVMLAQLEKKPFSREGWLFELKYDGYRVLAASSPARGEARKARRDVRLSYRSGLEATATFPDLARAVASLPYDHLVLDGEVVVLDDEARPRFQLLQQRARLSRPRDIERAAVQLPAIYYAFDLLGFDGYDLRPLPLTARKEILRQVLPGAGPIRFADHLEEHGEQLYEHVRATGVEGIVAKKADSAYRGGRSSNWIKIRAERTGDFAVVGYTKPQGARTGFGGLHLAVLHGARMVYAGRVGTGFSDKQLQAIRAQLDTAKRSDPPFSGPAPKGRQHVWVKPALVAEVKFTEYTKDGHLRHPVFVRLREDKPLTDCVRDDVPPPQEEAAPDEAAIPKPQIKITRPEKVFWPEEGYTKGDLVAYYRAISPWILPYLRDRPLVLDRYPDGIDGKSFFQKNAPEFAPEWVRTAPVWSEDSDKETDYFVCDDEETLVYLANSAAIPLHVWASRLVNLQAPDWCILDLDAKEAEFSDVVKVAREIRKLCRSIELPTFIKTSGASGLHVLVPLAGNCTFAQSRQLAQIVATVVSQKFPEIASIARRPASRKGRVYIDFLQNGHGKLLVSPLCVRPLPGATVSMPLRWSEVSSKLSPAKYTIKNAPKRMERLGEDPFAGILTAEPDLGTALSRLAELL